MTDKGEPCVWCVRSERGGLFICPASNGLVLKSARAFKKGGGLEWSGGGEFLK